MATFHQSAYSRTRPSVRGPTPPMVIGILRVGAGCCIAFVSVKCSPAKSNGLTAPEPAQDRQRLTQASRALGSARRADAERLELGRERTRTDTEFEAPAGRVVERLGLLGEHRRMTEGIAQHEMPDRERGGVGEHPSGDRHRLPHRLVGGERRNDVVHERHALEPDGLRGLRPFDDGLVGHPHLRQEQVEAGRTRRCRHAARVGQTRFENVRRGLSPADILPSAARGTDARPRRISRSATPARAGWRTGSRCRAPPGRAHGSGRRQRR